MYVSSSTPKRRMVGNIAATQNTFVLRNDRHDAGMGRAGRADERWNAVANERRAVVGGTGDALWHAMEHLPTANTPHTGLPYPPATGA